jgi:hypothetical protein
MRFKFNIQTAISIYEMGSSSLKIIYKNNFFLKYSFFFIKTKIEEFSCISFQ